MSDCSTNAWKVPQVDPRGCPESCVVCKYGAYIPGCAYERMTKDEILQIFSPECPFHAFEEMVPWSERFNQLEHETKHMFEVLVRMDGINPHYLERIRERLQAAGVEVEYPSLTKVEGNSELIAEAHAAHSELVHIGSAYKWLFEFETTEAEKGVRPNDRQFWADLWTRIADDIPLGYEASRRIANWIHQGLEATQEPKPSAATNFGFCFQSETLAALFISELQQKTQDVICPACCGKCTDVTCGSKACLEILYEWLRSSSKYYVVKHPRLCPFCKGKGEIIVKLIDEDWFEGVGRCTSCGAQTMPVEAGTADEAAIWAARAWNMRLGDTIHISEEKGGSKDE